MSSIFDIFRERGIIKEAEDDVANQAADAAQPDDTAPAADDTATDNTTTDDANNDDTQNNDNNNADDDFNIDTSLDTDTGVGDAGGDDAGGDSSSGSVESIDGGEVNKYNTNMFACLTAEEQKIKIKELKHQFQTIYDSICEMLRRINDYPVDEINIAIITRTSNALFELKQYIGDYIIYEFPQKSFYDNDVMLNRFLLVVSTLGNTLDKYCNKVEKELEDK